MTPTDIAEGCTDFMKDWYEKNKDTSKPSQAFKAVRRRLQRAYKTATEIQIEEGVFISKFYLKFQVNSAGAKFAEVVPVPEGRRLNSHGELAPLKKEEEKLIIDFEGRSLDFSLLKPKEAYEFALELVEKLTMARGNEEVSNTSSEDLIATLEGCKKEEGLEAVNAL